MIFYTHTMIKGVVKMKNLNRANVDRLTKQWDSGNLKDCYCLVFSPVWGFRIVWNNEDGQARSLKGNSEILQSYFVVLAVYETEEQAKAHFEDFVKWVDLD